MKKWKRLLVSLLTVSMTLGASTMSVMADDTTPYTYKVTLSAGNKGTINGQSKIEVSDISYGSRFSFDNTALYNIQVTDDRYYVKGIRLSGRDNASSEPLDAPAFTVKGDADYVVAYGIKGNMVAYTVNYQDASGKSLAESQTFYGNVGDKPVVAYRYVENYIPDALALTKTLSDNESENVFTFTYTPELQTVSLRQQLPSQQQFLEPQLLPVQQVQPDLPVQQVQPPVLVQVLQRVVLQQVVLQQVALQQVALQRVVLQQAVLPVVQRMQTILRIRQTIRPPHRMNRHQSLW